MKRSRPPFMMIIPSWRNRIKTTTRFTPSKGCNGLARVAPPSFPCQQLRGYCFYQTQPFGSRPAARHSYRQSVKNDFYYSSDCQTIIKCFLAAGGISAVAVASSTFWIATTREPDNIIYCDNKEPSSSFFQNSNDHYTPPSTFDSVSPRGPLRVLRLHPNLEICYDQRTRNAVYVQERLVVGADEAPSNHQRDTNQQQQPSTAPRNKKKNYRFKEESDSGTLSLAQQLLSRVGMGSRTFGGGSQLFQSILLLFRGSASYLQSLQCLATRCHDESYNMGVARRLDASSGQGGPGASSTSLYDHVRDHGSPLVTQSTSFRQCVCLESSYLGHWSTSYTRPRADTLF